MKISDNLRLAVVFMAVAGMMSPIATFGAAPTDAAVRKTVSVKDTKLAAGDALTGKVVDAQGNAIVGSTVSVRRGAQQAAQATTNAEGVFSVAGLTGGVYQIQTQGTSANYRVWTANAAPPAATEGVLLVDYNTTVTRGQCASGGCANSAPAYGVPSYGVAAPSYGVPMDMGAGAGCGNGGGEVVYGDGGQGQVVYGDGGGAGYGGGGEVIYGDGGAGYGGGGEVIYGDGGCGAGAGGGAVGYPVDAGYGYAGGGGLGGGGGGFLGFLSSPWVIGAGVAAAIAIPLALDDDDDDNAAGNGDGGTAS